jgi:cellulose synthase/poly-beta-1,6-N-acetylglucosamine synthase-like glycosyltransferase
LYFFFGLRKLKRVELKDLDNLPEISVIVAARNEEKNIEKTIGSLTNQNYNKDRYRIIVVNDRSEDKTGEILEDLKKEIPYLSILTIKEIPEGISPKKYALMRAVATTNTDYIATTDADCIHHPDWLRSYASLIEDNLGVATGVTMFYKKSYKSNFEEVWQEMQNIEYISHSIVAAGAIGQGRGFTCNGNNMIFNRVLYDRYSTESLKSQIISGDDFFVIQAAEKLGYKLKFNINQEAIVKTYPQSTISDVLNQRARWASKIGQGTSPVLSFGINTFVFYLGTILYLFFVIFQPQYLNIFLALLIIKIGSDTLYICYGFKKMKIRLKPIYYLLMQIFHIPFILTSTIKGFLGGFSWKGKKYSSSIS